MKKLVFFLVLVASFFMFNLEIQASPFVVSDPYAYKEITSPDGEQTEIAFAPRRLGERVKRFDEFNKFGTAETASSGGYILQSGTTDKILLSGTTDALMTSH